MLGAEIASTFENPSSIRLGGCKLIEEIMIGEDKLIHFSGVALGEACTIVLRGANSHLLDEAERSMHDALCVLSQTVANKGVIYGGGNPEISMARGIDEVAAKTPGAYSFSFFLYVMLSSALSPPGLWSEGFKLYACHCMLWCSVPCVHG